MRQKQHKFTLSNRARIYDRICWRDQLASVSDLINIARQDALWYLVVRPRKLGRRERTLARGKFKIRAPTRSDRFSSTKLQQLDFRRKNSVSLPHQPLLYLCQGFID